MHAPIRILALAASLLLPPIASAAEEAPLVRAELLAHAPATGEAWAGVRLLVKEGWHIYWRNPGDSGLATRVEWELPEGSTAGELRWPAPERFASGGMASFGYGGEVILPAALRLPTGTGSVQLEARVSWLACDEEACIPGSATVETTLRRGKSEPRVEQAADRLPAPAPWPVELVVAGDELWLVAPEAGKMTAAFFFPHDGMAIEHAAPQKLAGNDGLRLQLRRSTLATAAPERLEGVLLFSLPGGGKKAWAIEARKTSTPAAEAAQAK